MIIDDHVLKCAVGVLIADEKYDPSVEGAGVSSLWFFDGSWVPRLKGDDQAKALAHALNASGVPASQEMRNLLVALQEVHDIYDPTSWPTRLGAIATEHGLHE